MRSNRTLKIVSLIVMLWAGSLIFRSEIPFLLTTKLWHEQPLSIVSSIGRLIILGGIIYIMFRRVLRAYSNRPLMPGVTEQTLRNQGVIDALTKAGTNLNHEHLIEFAFYGDWNKLNKLRDYLISKGYSQVFGQTDKMLIVSSNCLLKIEIINELENYMIKLASEYGVEYDGWSTYPVKD